jgi:alginate O-acetyltransferase complex protein AlgI
MSIVSLGFLGFCLLLLLLYYRLQGRWQNGLLLAGSCAFCASWSYAFLGVLIGVTLFNYAVARPLERERPWRKTLLLAGVAVNLLTLAFFKYADFFVPEALALLGRIGLRTQVAGLQVLIPVGLSFYVLQAISYLVDVSRGQLKACRDPATFALYMSYFPRLTAGPIERARTFLPLLARRRRWESINPGECSTLILIGLVRKIVVADTLLRAIPAGAFSTPLESSGPELLVWLATYAFGIYSDFAGYTDIVRGVSGFFGLPLSRNFSQPLFSRTFSEFWNRWHISLSHWLRDYVYYPVSRALLRRSGGRITPAGMVLPPMLTMMASGIWHGSSANFLLWGGLMGGLLVAERLLAALRPAVASDKRAPWKQWASRLTVIGLAILTAVSFRMKIPVAIEFWQGLLDWSNAALPDSRVFLVAVPGLWIDWVQYFKEDELVFLKWPRAARAALCALALLTVFLFSRQTAGEPFIYQGF